MKLIPIYRVTKLDSPINQTAPDKKLCLSKKEIVIKINKLVTNVFLLSGINMYLFNTAYNATETLQL